jgi:hypothetical protein
MHDTTRHARKNLAVMPCKFEVGIPLLCDLCPSSYQVTPINAAREKVAGPEAAHSSNSHSFSAEQLDAIALAAKRLEASRGAYAPGR